MTRAEYNEALALAVAQGPLGDLSGNLNAANLVKAVEYGIIVIVEDRR